MKHLDHLTEIPFLVQTKCSLHVYVYGSLSASRTEITLQLYFSFGISGNSLLFDYLLWHVWYLINSRIPEHALGV